MTEASPLAFLVGTWVGEGNGEYPTIEPFTYREEATFSAMEGKPALAYTQRSWNLATGQPSHIESGFLRPLAPGRVELIIAHANGITEVSEGTVEARVIEVRSSSVSMAGSAKRVTELRRQLVVDQDVLRYELRMAALGHPLSAHLSAELRRG